MALVIANISIFSLVSCFGSESGITYHYSSRNLQRGKLFAIVYTVIFIQLIFFILTELIHKSITGSYWLISGKEVAGLLWGIIYLISISIVDKYVAFLNAAHFYTLCNRVIVVNNLLLCFFLAFYYFFKDVYNTFFYLQIFITATALQAIFLVLAFHISARQTISLAIPRREDWKTFFSYSFIVFFTNVIQFLAYRVDYWMVDYYHGKEALGLYSLATKLGQMLWVLPALLASIIFPLVADKEKKYNENNLFSLIRIANTGLLILALLSFTLAGWVIPVVIGEDYRPSVIPFLYLLPGLFLFCINIMLAAYFAGKGRPYVNLTGSVICFSLIVTLDFFLIPQYGIQGAAIASSIAYGTSGLYHIGRFSGFKKSVVYTILVIQRKDWNTVEIYLKDLFRKI